MRELHVYEVGPIRPPSESESLLLRLTRNCPWNKCKFCHLYKGQSFSTRSVDEVKADIDLAQRWVEEMKNNLQSNLLTTENYNAFNMVKRWYQNGMKSVFLQDANSLVMKPEDFAEILKYLRQTFPLIERVTVYGRSHTIAKISDEYLALYAEHGLNRVHIGMETGCNEVLDLVKKGVDKKTHILAGQKVKKAGMELSEYFMPGLGGNEYSHENAVETADALNHINPDFIRLRTFAIPETIELYEDYQSGLFTRTNDITMVKEIRTLIENLNGITSYVKSDHVLNLILEVEGRLPEDKGKMLSAIDIFLSLDKEEQKIFRIGRRVGKMQSLNDLNRKDKCDEVLQLIKSYQINDENIDDISDRIIKQYI